jgi:hypothetical protein
MREDNILSVLCLKGHDIAAYATFGRTGATNNPQGGNTARRPPVRVHTTNILLLAEVD